ncbi:MAG: hypothetical protein KatS3mg104_2463 [Phycisphaerae bacterium]|jgi:transglutaminase-like putative cysteine protease|nr:MAG: hypothetical protein KatS3mg104_2463 [Phycisphaerae bacterium]
MYDIKQFRPALYSLILLGFLGYAVAAEAPGIWVLATSATLINFWLIREGRFRPMPRLIANGVTLLFSGLLLLRVKQIPDPPILAIGEFLVLLQLVKLYEQRGNRDLAQLLVLSLLLMVSAAISTGSLLFGVIFIVYLFLSLYCCLLFHLKTETDHAKMVMGLDENKISPLTLRQDQRFLSRSMRRLTGFVSTIAIVMALVVFLFFPRGTGAGIIGNINFKPSESLTGFSDKVSFQDVARITQNESIVAKVNITKNGQPFGGPGETIYLRGSAPNVYISDPDRPDRWQWVRHSQRPPDLIQTTRAQRYELNPDPHGVDRYRQEIRLVPTGTDILFGLPGVATIETSRDVRLKYSPEDEVIQLSEPLTTEFTYTVYSTGQIEGSSESYWSLHDVPNDYNPGRRREDKQFSRERFDFAIPDKIRQFALRDDVVGKDARGNLAQQRLKTKTVSDLDEVIARNFETYLQNNFSYTLDLTDTRRLDEEDPLVQFLYDFKKGHCEYFAGAMALMCQSLGMKARVVVGFKCDEFNTIGGYYIVKQSDAHAWVEVLTLKGWQIFDPTAPRQAPTTEGITSAWKKFMYFLDYLEYSWGNNVVNYDAETRTNLIQNIDSTLTSTAVHTSGWIEDLKRQFDLQNFYWFSSGLISVLMMIMILIVVGALVYFLYERFQLRKRARRIGLEQLPSSDQKRLARQLVFYDDLLQVLASRRIERPSHLTPMEFSRSIGYLPHDVYSSIQRLTRIYYRIRYGGYEIDTNQQRRLIRVVDRIEKALGPVKL